MEGANRNIEIKCRCADLEVVREKALAMGAAEKGVLLQEDVFFRAPRARLKLRVVEGGRAELISYRRPDVTGTRGCDYVVVPAADPALLEEALSHALERDGAVRKRRRLLLLGNTRIHLDEVEGLGPSWNWRRSCPDDPTGKGARRWKAWPGGWASTRWMPFRSLTWNCSGERPKRADPRS